MVSAWKIVVVSCIATVSGVAWGQPLTATPDGPITIDGVHFKASEIHTLEAAATDPRKDGCSEAVQRSLPPVTQIPAPQKPTAPVSSSYQSR